MSVQSILLWAMGFGALIGGVDHLLGNRFGFGQRFEEAFQLLGPIALSMAGIICLAPLISSGLSGIIVPCFRALGLDPGLFGGILPIDMGGYPLAMDLADNAQIGRFSGILVAAIFGCTIIFTIPVGLGTMQPEDQPWFIKGILLGLAVMPVPLLIGGIACGLSLSTALISILPIVVLCLPLFWGLLRCPQKTAHGFQVLAKWIQKVAILGLTLGAIQYLTGLALLDHLTPLSEAMEVVCSIAIAMLGSMPLAELLQQVLKAPFSWIGRHTGLNAASTTGLLIGVVSVVPALAMVPRMDNRGKVVIGAFLVCGASTFAAHLAFTMAQEPQMLPSLLLAKLLGGVLGMVLALIVTGKQKCSS